MKVYVLEPSGFFVPIPAIEELANLLSFVGKSAKVSVPMIKKSLMFCFPLSSFGRVLGIPKISIQFIRLFWK